MTITDLVHVAEAIHNAEGWDLGKNSNREYRNAFWARVIGVVHHGHPLYNPAPDSRWLLKREPNGPQSDDVAAFWPSREAWDCIPGAGANGYRFEARYLGVLAPHQVIYAPPVPEGAGPMPTPPPTPIPPPPPPAFPYPDEPITVKAFQERVRKTYSEALRAFPDPNDADAYRHFARYGYSCHMMPEPVAATKHLTELRVDLGLPPVP